MAEGNNNNNDDHNLSNNLNNTTTATTTATTTTKIDLNNHQKTEPKIIIQCASPLSSDIECQKNNNCLSNFNHLSNHPNPLHNTTINQQTPTTTTAATTNNANTATVTALHTTESKRRISIASDPVSEGRLGYENLAFEQNPRRKVSQASLHSHSEIGPVRRKSILLNATTHDAESVHSHGSNQSFGHDIRPNGKPTTALETIHARLQDYQQHNIENSIEHSWIYALCLRCRVEDTTPSWEPPHWQKICPYPLCPTFRQFARIFSIVLIGVLIWIIACVIIGKTAAPGGQLFGLVVLTVSSHIGGWLISLTTLPPLIGMLLVGILFTNMDWVNLDGDFNHVTVELRKFALTIILIRAGLEMEPAAFKKVYKTILKIGIIPWTVECCVIAIMSHYLLNLPWIWGFLLGSIIGAVSPAVIVPCLFRLRSKGYGVAKGIPTILIAISGIDDALSVALFGIITSIMFSENNLAYQISQAPVCIIGGLAFGVVWGYMARCIPEKGDSYVVPIRTLTLFAGGLVAIFGSEKLGYEGAGPLGVVFAAFISNYFWCQQGWEIEDNPVSTAFEIFWMIFEPILFGITGTTLKFNQLDSDIVSVGIGCLVAAATIRIICTIGIAFGDKLNMKEKIFSALALSAKATVQAALGPIALKHLSDDSDKTLRLYATTVQTVSVLSIILAAPIGAIIITLSGTKLLKKTKEPHIVEGWRRSHRPSIRDISIIDEEEEQDDDAESTTSNKNQNDKQYKKHSLFHI